MGNLCHGQSISCCKELRAVEPRELCLWEVQMRRTDPTCLKATIIYRLQQSHNLTVLLRIHFDDSHMTIRYDEADGAQSTPDVSATHGANVGCCDIAPEGNNSVQLVRFSSIPFHSQRYRCAELLVSLETSHSFQDHVSLELFLEYDCVLLTNSRQPLSVKCGPDVFSVTFVDQFSSSVPNIRALYE